MVSSKRNKILTFILFLLPAFVLYTLFFIKPLIEGVRFSFTDWNGIVPEIPLTMRRVEFEENVLAGIRRSNDVKTLRRFYALDEAGENYVLRSWLVENGEERQLTGGERQRIKRILKSAGISPIKFIGLENYREMFRSDIRFIPRFEKRYLYNEFDDLPGAIAAGVFDKDLLPHIRNEQDRDLLRTAYAFHKASRSYVLMDSVGDAQAERLRAILAREMFQNKLIPGVIGFTLFFTVFNVILANLLALLLALALDTRIKARNALRSIFFLPNVLSLIIVAFIWSFVFRLILPAVTGVAVWLGSPDVAPWAVLMVSVWQSCGYLMIIYLAGLQTIPTDILEGAQVDGASAIQRFFHIRLPMLLPALTICLFYSLSNSLKSFDLIYALTNGGGPGYATTSVVIDIYNNAFLQNRFGYATAKAIVLCLIIMAVTGTQLFLMKKREVEL